MVILLGALNSLEIMVVTFMHKFYYLSFLPPHMYPAQRWCWQDKTPYCSPRYCESSSETDNYIQIRLFKFHETKMFYTNVF